MNSIIKARLTSGSDSLTGVPEDIQWMPPGQHRIVAFRGKEPVSLTVRVNEAVASRLIGQFETFKARSSAGQDDLPYIDFNHAGAEAAGHPERMWWAGEDPAQGGIRIKVAWTEPGRIALQGRAYRRFSPEFRVAKSGEIVGLGPNMGGLVNEAAFKSIQAIWSRSSQETTMNEEQQQQLAALVAGIKTLTGEVTTIKAKLASVEQAGAKITELESTITRLNEVNKIQAKAAATALVQQAVAEGRIAPQNTQAIEKFTNLIATDPTNSELLAGLPPSAPSGTIISARFGQSAGGGKPGEHQFIVKARAVAKERAISLTDAQSAVAGEDPALYDAYNASL